MVITAVQYIVPSLLTAFAMIVVQAIISSKQQRIQDVKTEYIIKEIKADIKRLEEKQDKHNTLIERMAVVERDMKTAFLRIDENKEAMKELEKHER